MTPFYSRPKHCFELQNRPRLLICLEMVRRYMLPVCLAELECGARGKRRCRAKISANSSFRVMQKSKGNSESRPRKRAISVTLIKSKPDACPVLENTRCLIYI